MTIRQMIARALLDAGLPQEEVVRIADVTATSLVRQMRTAGFALHDTRHCLQTPFAPGGRAMTEQELIDTGATEGGAG